LDSSGVTSVDPRIKWAMKVRCDSSAVNVFTLPGTLYKFAFMYSNNLNANVPVGYRKSKGLKSPRTTTPLPTCCSFVLHDLLGHSNSLCFTRLRIPRALEITMKMAVSYPDIRPAEVIYSYMCNINIWSITSFQWHWIKGISVIKMYPINSYVAYDKKYLRSQQLSSWSTNTHPSWNLKIHNCCDRNLPLTPVLQPT
jgi:hypothetical protein